MFYNSDQTLIKIPMISLIILVSLALTVNSCPTGGDRVWVELGDSCYSTSKLAMDWGTAQEVSLV